MKVGFSTEVPARKQFLNFCIVGFSSEHIFPPKGRLVGKASHKAPAGVTSKSFNWAHFSPLAQPPFHLNLHLDCVSNSG